MNLNASGENHTATGFYFLISNHQNLLKPQISNRTQYEEYYHSAIIMVKKGFAIMIGITMNSIAVTKKMHQSTSYNYDNERFVCFYP